MILLVDIGNSNITFGVYEEKLSHTFRVNSLKDKSCDEYYLMIKPFLNEYKIEGVMICSVVPLITSALKNMFEKYYNIVPFIMGVGIKTGLKINVEDPKSVGSDLIADSVASMNYYSECLVVDLGTATKFLYIKDRILSGVVIAPGVAISTKALINSAALLPNIELVAPKKVLNNSTVSCMQSGVIYGFASMIDGMISKIKKEVKNDSLPVIVTGGLSKLILPKCEEEILHVENLILEGLAYIYKKNNL